MSTKYNNNNNNNNKNNNNSKEKNSHVVLRGDPKNLNVLFKH